jgi:hypothetical protein
MLRHSLANQLDSVFVPMETLGIQLATASGRESLARILRWHADVTDQTSWLWRTKQWP